MSTPQTIRRNTAPKNRSTLGMRDLKLTTDEPCDFVDDKTDLEIIEEEFHREKKAETRQINILEENKMLELQTENQALLERIATLETKIEKARLQKKDARDINKEILFKAENLFTSQSHLMTLKEEEFLEPETRKWCAPLRPRKAKIKALIANILICVQNNDKFLYTSRQISEMLFAEPKGHHPTEILSTFWEPLEDILWTFDPTKKKQVLLGESLNIRGFKKEYVVAIWTSFINFKNLDIPAYQKKLFDMVDEKLDRFIS